MDNDELKYVKPRYIVFDLDSEPDEPEWSKSCYGPFDEFKDAEDYGNLWLQFFGVGEIFEPMGDE